MKGDQVTNAYDYSSLILLYIKNGTEKNPHAVLSEEDTVAKVYIDILSDTISWTTHMVVSNDKNHLGVHNIEGNSKKPEHLGHHSLIKEYLQFKTD